MQVRSRRYYSTNEVSFIFGVNESTIKRWTDSGKLKCFKTLGGHRRYSAESILEFAEVLKHDDVFKPAETAPRTRKTGGSMIDFLLLKKDYHTLREVYFADALRGDIQNLTRLLISCKSTAKIPLTVIYDEIVSKAINKIKNLGRQQKLNLEQQQSALNAILESFVQLRDVARHSSPPRNES
ncbi:MAG: helix-turn-helix domain-containing protein [Bacteroidota bacterium]